MHGNVKVTSRGLPVRSLPAGELIHKCGKEALGLVLPLFLFLLRRALHTCWQRGRRTKGDAYDLKARPRRMRKGQEKKSEHYATP